LVVDRIPNSLPHRHNLELEIYASEGVPKEFAEECRRRKKEEEVEGSAEIKRKHEARLREIQAKSFAEQDIEKPITLPVKKIVLDGPSRHEEMAGPSKGLYSQEIPAKSKVDPMWDKMRKEVMSVSLSNI